jgi:hypothetical protein
MVKKNRDPNDIDRDFKQIPVIYFNIKNSILQTLNKCFSMPHYLIIFINLPNWLI